MHHIHHEHARALAHQRIAERLPRRHRTVQRGAAVVRAQVRRHVRISRSH